MEKSCTTKSMFYGNSAKNILSEWKKCVLLQRSNSRYGIETVGESCRLFLYPIINNRQVSGLVVCGSSNARKDKYRGPEQHRKPYLFNVQKHDTMNAENRTAGETAMMGASYEERKNYMHQCLDKSGTAILVYFNENLDIRTFGIAEQGSEISLLSMLEQAAFRAQQVAEEVML